MFTFVIQGAVLAVGNFCLWIGSKGFSAGTWDARTQTLWALWPSESGCGQFVMQNPRWVNDDGQSAPFGAELLLIDSARVKWVEFSPVSEGSS